MTIGGGSGADATEQSGRGKTADDGPGDLRIAVAAAYNCGLMHDRARLLLHVRHLRPRLHVRNLRGSLLVDHLRLLLLVDHLRLRLLVDHLRLGLLHVGDLRLSCRVRGGGASAISVVNAEHRAPKSGF